MKSAFLFLFCPLFSFGQFDLEWKIDLGNAVNFTLTDFAMGVHQGTVMYNYAGHIYHIAPNQPIKKMYQAYPERVFFDKGEFYSKELFYLRKRNFTTGEILKEVKLDLLPNSGWPMYSGTFLSKINHNYYLADGTFFSKLDSSGNILFTKTLPDGFIEHMAGGGNSIVITTWLEGYLYQFDTLGNNPYTISLGGVHNDVVSDQQGNSYYTHGNSVSKFNDTMAQCWSQPLPDMYARRMFIQGDSLLLLVGSSYETDSLKIKTFSSFAILSCLTGSVLAFKKEDISTVENDSEDFTDIGYDGENVYVTGGYGNWGYNTPFLAKFGIHGPYMGVKEQKNKTDIKLFPIPVTDRLYISGLENDFQGEIQISNSVGQTLLKYNGNKITSLDVSLLPSGIYFLTVMAEGQNTMTRKILVE